MVPQRVILTTFAGRRDRMALLAGYAAEALRRGAVTEYHVWDYARTAEDRAWIASLPALHPGIRVFAPRGPRYDDYYDHYREEEYGDAVFIKADDDIVFVDLERLPGFVARRLADPEPFLLSANVVNNGVCAFFQQQQGAVPRTLMELPYPPGGFCGELWRSAGLATRLHRHFLAAPAAFARPGTTVAPDRLSINFVSYLGRDLRHLTGVRGDDEQALSVTIPRRLGRANLIDSGFVVAHLSFFSQDPGMDTAALIREYGALLGRTVAAPGPRAGERPGLLRRIALRALRGGLAALSLALACGGGGCGRPESPPARETAGTPGGGVAAEQTRPPAGSLAARERARPAARSGKVVRIRDGDSIVVLEGGAQVEVRLHGVDAPELGQAYGRRAKSFAGDLSFGRQVELKPRGKDDYDRTLAEVILPDGRSLNRELVSAGLAWHYRKYSDDADLAAREDEARAARRGLWADRDPVPPWDFRESRR